MRIIIRKVYKLKMKCKLMFKWIIKKIEALGLIILLISFGWQIIESNSSSLSREVDLYHINQKIDAIWSVLSAEYIQDHSNETNSYKSVNINAYEKSWMDWGKMKKDKEYLNNQLRIFMWIRILLYLIGSIMIIYPKLKNNTA